MATYTILNGGAGPQFNGPHAAPFMINIDNPGLIAGTHPWKLANTSNVETNIASTGWAAADIFEAFEVLAGFVLKMVGARVTTAEGGAATLDIGNDSATETHLLGAAAAGFMGTCDLNTAGTQITLVTDTDLGGDTTEGVVFITDGTIDITWNTAATAVCVLDVWAEGYSAWNA